MRFTEQHVQIIVIIVVFYFLSMVALCLLLRQLTYKNRLLQNEIEEIQSLNKSKDFFLGIIAHDLRRPLSSLLGMAGIVDFYLKAKRFEELDKISISIDRSGNEIRKLLDNLLHWIRFKDGRYQPEVLNIENEINSVLELYNHSILEGQIKCNLIYSGSLTVLADRNGLALILRNLIDNALKHLPAHGELSIRVSETPSSRVQIRVKDNGKGMTEEKLSEIRYILAYANELVPGQIGNSLGMLLIGRFIKINQATIDVESSLETGTVFTITLPHGGK